MIDEVRRSDSRFATADQVASLEVAVARLGARFDAMEARIYAMEARNDARFDAVDARFGAVDARFNAVDAQFASLRRENRLWFTCLIAAVGVLMGLFRYGVL